MTREERRQAFIDKASAMPEHHTIDYTRVVYVDNRTPVELYDRAKRPDGTDYGVFWQTPSNHLKGRCHPDRRSEKISSSKVMSQEDVIRKFREVHKGEKLDYSRVRYVNMHTEVEIVCHEVGPDGNEYGSFWQTPANHLKGCSHPRLAIDRNSQEQMMPNEEYIKLVKEVHSDHNYDYSLVEYKGRTSKIKVICNRIGADGKPHGIFIAWAGNFLNGKGCPKCGNHLSYAEGEIISLLKSLDPSLRVGEHERGIIPPLELDMTFPDHRLAVEYDGLRWHCEDFAGKGKDYHLNKTIRCNEAGWKLIHVFEDEYKERRDIVLEKLSRTLSIGDVRKLHARKCDVRTIDSDTAETFLERNHIQGYKAATTHYGAFCEGELVGVMSFTRVGEEWELCRFATLLWCSVRGLASKMFKRFVIDREPTYVKSFADRRWTVDPDNNVYTKIGFVLDSVEKPDYTYYNKNVHIWKRFHKFGFSKGILHRRHGLPMEMTEREMTRTLGYDRVWDCGLFKYVWRP